eukprot:761330-Hanusia_phi.AAC.3
MILPADRADVKPLMATESIAGMTMFAETEDDRDCEPLNSADVSNLIQSVRNKCASLTKYLKSFEAGADVMISWSVTLFF